MEVDGFLWVFLLGGFGGVLVELWKWFQLRESPNFPSYVRSVFYWGITVAMIAAGGVLAALYGTDGVNAILAVNIGASAPAIIRTLATTVPQLLPPGPARAPDPAPAPAPAPSPSPVRFLSTR